MKKVIPSFYYEPLTLILESKTSYQEEEKGQNGARPLDTRTIKEEPVDLRGGRDNSQKEVGGMKYVLKHSFKPL